MKIEMRNDIKIRDIVEGYPDHDDNDESLMGMNGKLEIRPIYQRKIVYKQEEQAAVVESILAGRPINVMYFEKRDDGTYAVMDGQQRICSICRYIRMRYPLVRNGEEIRFKALSKEEQDKILDYDKMIVYICSGSKEEILDWFKTINISGKPLYNQEIRNAIYCGPWTTEMKRYFSKNNAGVIIGKKYMKNDDEKEQKKGDIKINRFKFMEEALKWFTGSINEIEPYMNKHKDDEGDIQKCEVIVNLNNIIEWVEKIFPDYNAMMKGVDWDRLYREYKDIEYNIEEVNKRIKELSISHEIEKNRKNIYEFVLGGEQDNRLFELRTFDDEDLKLLKYNEQEGKCKVCGKHFDIKDMEADHIDKWVNGGKTEPDNCRMLCRTCNRIANERLPKNMRIYNKKEE